MLYLVKFPTQTTLSKDHGFNPSIRYGMGEGVPYCASYNAELLKQLTPKMAEVLKQSLASK